MNVDQISALSLSIVTKNSVHVIHDVTTTVGKTPIHRAVQNLPAQKRYSMYILTMWYCILLDFKNILKFMNFTEF